MTSGAKTRRMGTKLRTNIKKKVNAHHKKVRKEAKKLRTMGVKKKGVSNISAYIRQDQPTARS